MPRRPSEVLGIEDDLEALLTDVTFLEAMKEPTSKVGKYMKELNSPAVKEYLKRRGGVASGSKRG